MEEYELAIEDALVIAKDADTLILIAHADMVAENPWAKAQLYNPKYDSSSHVTTLQDHIKFLSIREGIEPPYPFDSETAIATYSTETGKKCRNSSLFDTILTG